MHADFYENFQTNYDGDDEEPRSQYGSNRSNNWQFVRNQECRKCKTPKAATEQEIARPPARSIGNDAATLKSTGGGWRCYFCKDFQFARNRKCRNCRVPKSTTKQCFAEHEVLEGRKERKRLEELRKLEEIERHKEITIQRLSLFPEEYYPNCFGVAVILPYFQRVMQTYVPRYPYVRQITVGGPLFRLMITLRDSDPAGLRDDRAGICLCYLPSQPDPSRKYRVDHWLSYRYRNEPPRPEKNKWWAVAHWSEPEMLWYTSFDPDWHKRFSSAVYRKGNFGDLVSNWEKNPNKCLSPTLPRQQPIGKREAKIA